MAGYTFEDLQPGFVARCGPVTVSREEIVAFARQYDPQPFHLDEEAARSTFVGRLIASGWQTCALTMRMLADDFLLGTTAMGSPGIDAVRWLRPVAPDDTLVAGVAVRESRPSASKPDRGMVRFVATVANGAGEPVLEQDFWVMFGRRGAPPPAARPAPPPWSDPVEGRTTESADEPCPTPFFDEVEIGTASDLGSYRFEADDIVAFGRAYDPQPFHVDAEAAARTHFGALCASGWQTASAWMGRLVAMRARERAVAEVRGLPVPRLGPSPGFTGLKWLGPVYAGDRLRFATTVTDKRPSASRPDRGLVFQHNTGVNQRGETVFTFEGSNFWERRRA